MKDSSHYVVEKWNDCYTEIKFIMQSAIFILDHHKISLSILGKNQKKIEFSIKDLNPPTHPLLIEKK